MGKVLVVYYSYEGNTRLIAERIAQETGADILELKPVKDITSKGFMKYVWGGRQAVMGSRPKLMPLEKNHKDYDLLFIGTPVWAATYTPAMKTFINDVDLSRKNIALFCTHEGGLGKTFINLKRELLNSDIISEKDFINVKRNTAENLKDAENWAKSLKQIY